MKRLDWDDTTNCLILVKQGFVAEHNKPKDQIDEAVLKSLRKLAQALGDRRIEINVSRLKESKV